MCFSNVVIIFEIVSISIDLSWMFMPSWPHVSEILRLLRRLEASWGVLGRLKGIIGSPWKSFGAQDNPKLASKSDPKSMLTPKGRFPKKLIKAIANSMIFWFSGASWERLGASRQRHGGDSKENHAF